MILAIDPGVSTGIAIRMDDGDFQTVTVRNKEDLYGYIQAPVSVVVYETFQAQMISGYGLHTVRLVGAIEALCWYLKIKAVSQMPQQRKAYASKATALLHTKKTYKYTVHEMDALSHLLAYEARQG